MIGRLIHHDTMTDLQVVKSTISSSSSDELQTLKSVKLPIVEAEGFSFFMAIRPYLNQQYDLN